MYMNHKKEEEELEKLFKKFVWYRTQIKLQTFVIEHTFIYRFMKGLIKQKYPSQ